MKATNELNAKQRRIRMKRDKQPCDAHTPLCTETPRTLSVVEYCAARSREVSALKQVIDEPKGGTRAFQTLPNHLRRRSMSHNVYRVPTRLRDKAKVEAELIDDKPKKKKNRRARRRPAQLMCESARRQSKCRWLETHIWHAKRMKMETRYGYRLAVHPVDKGIRATLQAAHIFSTIYDASYTSCIELRGSFASIIKAITPLLSVTHAQALQSPRRCSGSVVLNTLLVDNESRAIGPAQIQWNPQHTQHSHRSLWLWIHPTLHSSLMRRLNSSKPLYQPNVCVESLDGEFVRFELRGLRTHTVLANTLQLITDEQPNTTGEHHQNKRSRFWSVMRYLRSASCAPPCALLALDVQDLRYTELGREVAVQSNTLDNRVPASVQCIINEALEDWPTSFASSRLWDDDIRSSITAAVNTPNQVFSGVPVMLIQRSSASRFDYASGWDIIAPKGWGMLLWRKFVFAGARAIGMSNRRAILAEQGLPCFPEDYVDTKAGNLYAKSVGDVAHSLHQRTPPAKRINYVSNRIQHPFVPNWMSLFDGSKNSSLPRVVRDDVVLRSLHDKAIVPIHTKLDESSLIRVEIRPCVRGALHDNALICAATTSDIVQMNEHHKHECKTIEEPIGRPTKDGAQDTCRDIIGFVVRGHYSRLLGSSCAYGYVALKLLLQLCETSRVSHCKGRWFVLVRNTSSRVYIQALLRVAMHTI